MYVVTIYQCEHSIKSVLANISRQSMQSCTPLVNKQFAPGFQMRYTMSRYAWWTSLFSCYTAGKENRRLLVKSLNLVGHGQCW